MTEKIHSSDSKEFDEDLAKMLSPEGGLVDRPAGADMAPNEVEQRAVEAARRLEEDSTEDKIGQLAIEGPVESPQAVMTKLPPEVAKAYEQLKKVADEGKAQLEAVSAEAQPGSEPLSESDKKVFEEVQASIGQNDLAEAQRWADQASSEEAKSMILRYLNTQILRIAKEYAVKGDIAEAQRWADQASNEEAKSIILRDLNAEIFRVAIEYAASGNFADAERWADQASNEEAKSRIRQAVKQIPASVQIPTEPNKEVTRAQPSSRYTDRSSMRRHGANEPNTAVRRYNY